MLAWRLTILLIAVSAKAQTCDFGAAVRHHQAGELEAAAAGYEACIAADPGRVDARSNLGAVLVKQGHYREAIAQYLGALKMAPAEVVPNLRFNLGLAYYKSFEMANAVSQFEPLHAAQPDNLTFGLILADCYLQMGEFQKAEKVAAPLEGTNSGNLALDYVLGMALIRSGKVAEGQIRVDRILRRGESAEGRFLLGAALFAGGNYPEAVKELTRAATINPDLPSVQSYLGQALLFTGDADGAVQAFRKELAANPNDFDANFQLASILARRGQPDESKRLLERAVLVRPDSEEARAALAGGFRFEAKGGDDPGIPVGSAAPPVGPVSMEKLARPVALVFGSYTCPKLRASAAELKRIAAHYGRQVDFRLVYISEAHAKDGGSWQSTVNEKERIDLPNPRNLPEKEERGALCLRKLELPFALVVDDMDGAAERTYQAWPSRLYLISREGKVAYQTRLGELDFHADAVESAIRALLGGGSDGHQR